MPVVCPWDGYAWEQHTQFWPVPPFFSLLSIKHYKRTQNSAVMRVVLHVWNRSQSYQLPATEPRRRSPSGQAGGRGRCRLHFTFLWSADTAYAASLFHFTKEVGNLLPCSASATRFPLTNFFFRRRRWCAFLCFAHRIPHCREKLFPNLAQFAVSVNTLHRLVSWMAPLIPTD